MKNAPMAIAGVAVSAAVYSIDKPYDYAVPADMTVVPGMRVSVPFGRANRITEGIVLSVTPAGKPGCKQIAAVLDDEPVLDSTMLHLAAFVRERCYCTFFEAIHAMLPSGLWFRSSEIYTVADDLGDDWQEKLTDRNMAKAVLQLILDLGGTASYDVLNARFADAEALQKALRYLVGKKLLNIKTKLSRRAKEKMQTICELTATQEELAAYCGRIRRSAPLQYAVLQLLGTVGSAASKELCYFTGANTAVLRRLEQLGLLKMNLQPVLQTGQMAQEPPAEPPVLNEQQQAAYRTLCEQMQRPKPGAALLYGVTGSGKTAVYLRLIHRCLKEGRSAMVLVPEIALTPQLLRLFAAQFGDCVAVLHSALRASERYSQWKRIRAGQARVVLGTRSAVFAPLQQPGLIVLDEEQEHTYKSENTPRYHAKEVALWRGVHENCMVLLGSATPSIETMYHAQQGDYSLCRLTERYRNAALPEVTLVDMKQELRAGNGSSISRPLYGAIAENLSRGEQTILFLNRRGNSRMLVCPECGDVAQCPNCSVHLTYHSANSRLMCHYCGYSIPAERCCGNCGSRRKPVGVGTQRVQQELAQLFPEAEVLRMDADTVSATNSHEKILDRFLNEKIPILLGTQMVAKGLNFDNVTLVGVLDADLSLYTGNYRAAETTFAMLTQVVGRAGRGGKPGRAVIQTMTPAHTVLQLAARQDYDAFYDQELAIRRAIGCPPFGDLLFVTLSGALEQQVLRSATYLREQLRAAFAAYGCLQPAPVILGPAAAAVAKVNNRYRYRLTVRCKNSRDLRRITAQQIRACAKDKNFRGVAVYADCNPYNG